MVLCWSAQAATNTWLSGGGANASNWNRNQNWSLNAVPGSAGHTTDDVVIPTTPAGGTGFPILSTSPTINSLTIQSGAALAASGSVQTMTVITSITGAGALTGGGSSFLVGGDMTVATFTAGTSSVTFTGAGTVGGAYTFNNLTINASGTATLGGNTTVNGTFALTAGTLAVGANTLALNSTVSGGGTLTSSATGTVSYNQGSNGQSVLAANYGNLTFSNFNKTLASSGTIGIASAFTAGSAVGHTITGSAVDFNGGGAQTIPAFTYNNLNTSTGGTKTLAGAVTVNNLLTVGASTTLDLSTQTLTLACGCTPLVINGTFTASASTVKYTNAAATTITAANYNSLDGTGGNRTLPNGGTVGISGTFTPGAGTYTITGSTVNFDGAGAQSVPAFTYNNLNTATSGTKTLAGAVTVNSVLTVGTSTTLDLGTQTLTLAGSSTPLVINGTFTASTSTVKYTNAAATNITAANYNSLDGTGGNRTLPNGGTVGISGSFTPGAGTYTITGSTVNYNGTSGQTVAAFNYNNLTISAGRTTNSVTLGSGTIGVAGSFSTTATFTTGNYVVTGSTVEYNGAAAQTLNAFTYGGLRINNSSGVALTGGDATVNSALTLNSGNVSAGSNTVIIASTGSVTHNSGHVIGNLRRTFTATTDNGVTRTFDVGDTAAYAPVQIIFATITSTGTLTVKATAGLHPDIGNSGIEPTQSPTKQSVNRYWTATNNGIVFSDYSAVVNYVSGDLDAGLDLTTVGIAKADGCDGSQLNCTWTYPTSATVTATSFQGASPCRAPNTNCMTGFSDFGLGHKVDHFIFTAPGTATPGTPFSVTITAVDKNDNVVTGFTGSATITSLNGNCLISAGTPTGSFTSAPGQYTGSVTISGACSDQLKATQVGNSSVTGTSGTVTVTSVSNFNAFETSTAVNAVTGQIYTKLASVAFSLDVVAVAGASQAAGFSDNVKVELLGNTGTAGSGYGADNCPSSNTVIQTVNPAAISGGRSTVNFSAVATAWRDVRVRISYPTTSPTVVKCSLDSFAIRPQSFTVSSSTATQTGSSGTPAIKTGAAFDLSAAAGSGYDGTPSIDNSKVIGSPNAGTIGGAFSAVSSGTATGAAFYYSEVGNFGLSAEAVYDSSFTSVDQPNDCTAGFSNALVGGKYGCSIGSTAVPQTTGTSGFGRFIPDNFDVTLNVPQFGAACGIFSYVGQAFAYTTAPVITVTARNGSSNGLPNVATKNYAGSYVKLTNTTLTPGTEVARYSRFDALGGGATPSLEFGALDATSDPVIGAFSNGVGTLTFSAGTGFKFTRSTTTANAPFNADIVLQVNVIDADNVAYAGNPASFGALSAGGGIAFGGGKAMRFGRLRLQNSAGLLNVDLPIPVETQYWTGSAFTTNADDQCTQLTSTNMPLGPYTGGINATNMDTGHVTVGGAFVNGVGRLRLTKPSPAAASPGGTTLTVDLTAEGKTYLQGAWTGGTYTSDPSARATFGVFGSQPRNFIYQRENY